MLDILSAIKEAAKESNAFENHPAKELSLEERLLYLQGLALVMNSDGEIHPEETDYLLILIRSLDLDESVLESCIEFSKQPDKNTIQSILKTFRRKPIAQLFIFDALMLSYRDGQISESEKEVIDELALQFEVIKGTYSDIYDLFCHIKNKNWEGSALYFNTHLLNHKFFNHILDYYEVDLDEVSKHAKEISKKKIIINIKDKVREGVSNEVLLPFFQSKIDRGQASVQSGVLIIPEVKYVKLSSLKLGYDQISKCLYIDSYILVKDIVVLNYFYNSVDVTIEDRYILMGGTKKIIKSQISHNNRVLSLETKLTEGSLIDISGVLWEYKAYRGKCDLFGESIMYSTSKRDFKHIENYDCLILHTSLTDKSVRGSLTRVIGE
ncbi:TerB family tellurite resistance protein [Vibrio alginolyticus]|nr:TerB family tellurite resistance protein [Vibrio alginolyticus]